MTYRGFGLSMLAGGLATLLLASTAVAEKPQRGSGTSDDRNKGTAASLRMIQGRIVSANAPRRELVVVGMMSTSPSTLEGDKAPRDRTSGSRDQGTTGRNANEDRNPADRNASDRTGAGRGIGSTRENTYTFQTSPTARITLDGRSAELTDLRADQFVRVMARQASSQASTGRGDTNVSVTQNRSDTTDRTATASNKPSAAGVRMTAQRIEAFTKPPAGFPQQRTNSPRNR
jgi:hypothetical protein